MVIFWTKMPITHLMSILWCFLNHIRFSSLILDILKKKGKNFGFDQIRPIQRFLTKNL
jgi:hypothetical protein